MASIVNQMIGSTDLGGGLIPTEYSNQIIQDIPKQSVMLSRARQITMSTRTRTQPVLDSKPIADWVGGDTGLKQTTKMSWSGLNITAEELAAIVPIPEAVINDAGIPIWNEVMPRLTAAIGYKLDQACLFGTDKPSSFPDGIIPQAITAGNKLTQGTDLAADVATMGQKLAEQGFAMNGFASQPGLNWQLIGLRDNNGAPIYVPSLASGAPSTLYGYGLNEVDNGAWDMTKAVLLGADWSNFVIGVRQDITCPDWQQARPSTLRRICCAVAKRAMLAGDDTAGVSQHTETAGSYSESYSYSNPAGDLYLTSAEKKSLGVGCQRAFSVDMMPEASP